MLFRPEHVQPILERTKWETRRLWDRPMVKVGGFYWAQTKLFNNDSRFARIRVTGLERQRLDAITEESARAEGYSSVQEFKAAFLRINKLTTWPGHRLVYRVIFELHEEVA